MLEPVVASRASDAPLRVDLLALLARLGVHAAHEQENLARPLAPDGKRRQGWVCFAQRIGQVE